MKRMLLGLLLFGLLELTLLIKAGEVFGTWFPIVAVVGSMAAGTSVIRHYGIQTLNRLKHLLRNGVPSAGPRPTGLAGVLAGILLILPGFLSDLAAIMLLIPSTRRLIVSALGWRLTSAGSAGRRKSYGPIIEAEAVEIRAEVATKSGGRPASPWQRS